MTKQSDGRSCCRQCVNRAAAAAGVQPSTLKRKAAKEVHYGRLTGKDKERHDAATETEWNTILKAKAAEIVSEAAKAVIEDHFPPRVWGGGH